MAASACQWLGVAVETASMEIVRERLAHIDEFLGLLAGVFQQTGLATLARGLVDVAQPGDTRTGQAGKLREMATEPTAPEAMMAMLTRSFAPKTRVADAAAAAPIKNRRVVLLDMF